MKHNKASLQICARDQEYSSYTSSRAKVEITVLSCCGASGYTILHFVIFDHKSHKPDLTLVNHREPRLACLTLVGWTPNSFIYNLKPTF